MNPKSVGSKTHFILLNCYFKKVKKYMMRLPDTSNEIPHYRDLCRSPPRLQWEHLQNIHLHCAEIPFGHGSTKLQLFPACENKKVMALIYLEYVKDLI